MKKTINSKVERLVISGAMLGLAFVLSCIKLKLPYGGSVTLFSMVPIVLVGCLYGNLWGLLTGFVYSLLQLLQNIATSNSFLELDGKIGKIFLMLALDFLVAFSCLGLGGMFVSAGKKKAKSIPGRGAAGALVVTLVRYASHVASGAILFGAWAEWFFSENFTETLGKWALGNLSGARLGFVYSLVYNGLYMLPETVITVLGVFAVLSIGPVKKLVRRN